MLLLLLLISSCFILSSIGAVLLCGAPFLYSYLRDVYFKKTGNHEELDSTTSSATSVEEADDSTHIDMEEEEISKEPIESSIEPVANGKEIEIPTKEVLQITPLQTNFSKKAIATKFYTSSTTTPILTPLKELSFARGEKFQIKSDIVTHFIAQNEKTNEIGLVPKHLVEVADTFEQEFSIENVVSPMPLFSPALVDPFEFNYGLELDPTAVPMSKETEQETPLYL